MDAKPQRPLRALRVRDENAPPAVQAKTIHQRNKSTPALSSLMQNGALKAAAKRTAFADVSNTSRVQHPVKDDLAVSGKGMKKDATLEISKSSTILRPAQRPNSTASQKIPHQTDNSKENVPEPVAQPVQAKKITAKRSTAIFREPAPVEVKPSKEPLAPVQKPHSTRRERSNTAPELSPPAERMTQVETIAEETIEEHAPSVPREESTTSLQTAVVAEENYGHPVTQAADPLSRKEPKHATGHEQVELPEQKTQDVERHQVELLSAKDLLAVAELDKYEDYYDEEDEDYYDADGYTGYTTTRSLRPRADTTTGGVTVVLAPRVTARTRAELEAARQWVEDNKTAEDIEDEVWDTSMVAEYGDEIFEYMRALEERMKPNPFYMDNQAEIQWSMRSVLMDWLVQVHHRFTLLPETLFLAVNYVDRFLSCKVVSLGKLQLVGATAIFVAAKYEEINCPSVSEIVYMVDGGYTVDEILKAERFMLSMLQFELGWPGPMSFLRRISKADDYDLETRTLAKYFLEITIMDERFVGCTPSFTAAGAHCLARFMLKKGDWSPAHVHYSGYTYSQLRPLVSVILECSEQPQKHHAAVYDKYSDKRYKRASLFVETELHKGFQLPSISRDCASSIGYSSTWRRM
ncbi:uncharacterized protein K452DRAFT_273437 [Aplosporella prunicola CBS 121167]|uniref:Uncharacterized protein n=1 Tax=Aplosporella prunicola CBS 121167 TaxID=1176127 RepID=A0A6A6B8W0_9PEZI|nr:uncharacterized protein K452DRAFT_273437 [Aplosporella prunicola CBS 121167]KAF2140692.1 hypothetical protein K452DRAFT_273437 [Aplosporella prunicola CBS 121167]